MPEPSDSRRDAAGAGAPRVPAVRLPDRLVDAALTEAPGAVEALLVELARRQLRGPRRPLPAAEAFVGRLRGGMAQSEDKLLVQVRGRHEVLLPQARLVMEPGDALVVPAQVEHRERALPDPRRHCHVVVVPQGDDVYWHAAEFRVADNRVIAVSSRRSLGADGLVLRDLLRLAGARISAPAEVGAAVRGDALTAIWRLLELMPARAPVRVRGGDPCLSACRQAIQRGLADPDLTVAGIAAELDLHPNYLSTRYRELTGTTVSRAIASARIAEACRLLATTSAPLASVAVRCGYRGMRTFSRTFLRMRGITPSHFRRLSLIENLPTREEESGRDEPRRRLTVRAPAPRGG